MEAGFKEDGEIEKVVEGDAADKAKNELKGKVYKMRAAAFLQYN